MKDNIYFSEEFKLKQFKNIEFSSKYLLRTGVQLGGHLQSLNLRTTSVVYGVRYHNVLINNNPTLLELRKVMRVLEGLGNTRSTVYFINSMIGLSSIFKKTFNYYNKHLFAPFRAKITHVFRKLKALKICEKFSRKYKEFLGKRRFFLYSSGKCLLRKLFAASKWQYGFVSNSSTFFKFVDNVIHEKIKIGKILEVFDKKVKDLIDFYPCLPQYGFICDQRSNYWIVNEFKKARVPNNSLVDTMTDRALHTMYGVPGNGASADTSLFFLSLLIANYVAGYNQRILKFMYKNIYLDAVVLSKKKFFFKKFRKFL